MDVEKTIEYMLQMQAHHNEQIGALLQSHTFLSGKMGELAGVVTQTRQEMEAGFKELRAGFKELRVGLDEQRARLDDFFVHDPETTENVNALVKIADDLIRRNGKN